jgi:hypothetical protein
MFKVRIYDAPKADRKYAVGADVAEGIESGDFSTAFVIDSDLNQVASFHGHLDPDLFGKLLCKIGAHYNNAILAVEVNNHGHATMAKMKDLNYPNIYYRMVLDELTNEMTQKLGWQTNVKTKMRMLDNFVAAWRDDCINIKDADLLREMLSVIVLPTGDIELTGKDRLVSACIALQAISQITLGKFKAFTPEDAKRPRTLEERLKFYERTNNSYDG